MNLVSDDRHYGLEIIHAAHIHERKWDKWAMAYATPTPHNQSLYLKYSSGSEFNPYAMSAESIAKLLMSMRPAEEPKSVEPANRPAKKKGFFNRR